MPQFCIIRGRTETPKEEWEECTRYGRAVGQGFGNSDVFLYNDAPSATERAKSFKSSYPRYAYMIKKVPEVVDYVSREQARGYTAFEYQGKDYHCAELVDGKVSFYTSLYNAYEDRRTSQKIGRYLRQYFDDFSEQTITNICARYGVESEDAAMHWAKTSDEIVNVYLNGPDSCMADDASNYNSPGDAHPVSVYGSGDIWVAYLVRDGNITARTLVNPENKEYVYIYGDSARLSIFLEKEGYTKNSNALDGCRILRTPCRGGDWYLCPYQDGNLYATAHGVDDDYLVLNTIKGGSAGEAACITVESTKSDYTHDCDPYEDDDDDSWNY